MSLGERNIETTTKSLAPSGWRATSFCVSVTTSLISFNYFNCFYMNNSSIFPISYGLDYAVWCCALPAAIALCFAFADSVFVQTHVKRICDFNHLVRFIFHLFLCSVECQSGVIYFTLILILIPQKERRAICFAVSNENN